MQLQSKKVIMANRGTLCFFKICIILLVLIGLIPLLIVAFHTFPSLDDYGYSASTYHFLQQGGNLFDLIKSAIDTSKSFFLSWQGLYSSAFLLALQPGIFGTHFYFFTTIFLFAFSFLGFYSLSFALTKYVLQSSSKAWKGVAFFTWFFFIQTLPSPFEGYYWWNGGVNYLFFWSLLAFIASYALFIINSWSVKKWIHFIVLSFMVFFLAGGNHITTVACIMIFFTLLLFEIKTKKSIWFLIPLIVCCLGLYIVMSAPGTLIRAESLGIANLSLTTKVKHFTKALFLSFYQLGTNVGSWISLSTVFFILLLLPFFVSICQKGDIEKLASIKNCVLVFMFFVIFLAFQFLPVLYAEGFDGDVRLKNVLYASFLIFMWAMEFFIVARCVSISNSQSSLGGYSFGFNNVKALFCIFSSLLIILFSYGSHANFQKCAWSLAFNDISSGRIMQFQVENNNRLKTILNTEEKNIVIDSIKTKPEILEEYKDISEDPNFWSNKQMSQYFGKESIVISDN